MDGTPLGDVSLDAVEEMAAHVRIAYYEMANRPEMRQDVPGAVMVEILGRLALAYADESRLHEAIATGERALRLIEEEVVDDDALRARVLSNLGAAYSEAGDGEQAVSAFLDGWACARRAGDEEMTLAAGANALLALERVQSAEPAFLAECLPVFEAAGRMDERARALRLLGAAQLAGGRPGDAVGNLDKALATSAALPARRVFTREVVALLEKAAEGLDAPPPGLGVLGVVRELVDDGVESLDRGRADRARTCFQRAANLLSRGGTSAQRELRALLAVHGESETGADPDRLRTLAYGVFAAEGAR